MDVSVDCKVGEAVGWLVEVTVVAMLVGVTSRGVSEEMVEISWSGKLDQFIRRIIPYANPPRTTRLMITRSNTPAGLMRIVHPVFRRRERADEDDLEGSNWAVIIS